MAQRPYLRDRLIEDKPEGFVVIVPVGAPEPTPLACPLCEALMRSQDDGAAHNRFGCCDRCAQLWAWPRKAAWAAGWRPSAEQLREAEASRPPLSISFNVS